MTLAHRIVVMNQRRIEQIGAPMDVYLRPETSFVAGFVGTPAMNFVAVDMAPSLNGFASVRLPDGAIVATRIDAGGLPRQPQLKLGVRAESVRIRAPGQGVTTAQAKFIERLGERTLVHAQLANGTTIVAEDAGVSRVAMGDSVGLHIDEAGVHLFDEQRGYHAAQ
jgi:multiple sugar transport system ATP-binding protein